MSDCITATVSESPLIRAEVIQGAKGDPGDSVITQEAISGALGFLPDNPDSPRTPTAHTHTADQIADFAEAVQEVSPPADWNTLANKPSLGTAAGHDAGDFATAAQGTKADSALQSGAPISAISGLQTALDGKQTAGSYATLDGSNKVPASQLPSYVDDVLEYSALSAFPATGETGKIYTALDNNKIYRWSGSTYVEISPSPGSTDSVTEGSLNLYFTAARAVSALASTLASYATQAWVTAQGYITSASLTWGNITGKPTSFTPSAHAASHAANGSDALTLSSSQVTGLSTVATTGSYSDLSGKPTIPAAQVNSDWNATTGVAQILNKPTLFSGAYADLTGKPVIPSTTDGLTEGTTNLYFTSARALSAVTWSTLTGKPSTFAPSAHASSHASGGSDALTLAASQITGLASVATSGAYSSLTGTPTLATVATSGSASDLGTGTLPDARLSSRVSFDDVNNAFTAGQTITAAANTSALTASYSVTGANTTPLLNLSGTWNTTGIATGLKLNVTDTASNAASLLADLGIGSRTQYAFTKARQFWLYNSSPATQDASNYERGFFRWNSNVLEIGAEAGGTGTNRAVQITSVGGTINFYSTFLMGSFSTGRFNANNSCGVSGSGAFDSNYGCQLANGKGVGWNASGNTQLAPDTAIFRNSAGVLEVNNGTAGTFRDLRVRNVIQASGITTSVTPSSNGDLVIEQTSNTSITFRMKGTDGTVRSQALALDGNTSASIITYTLPANSSGTSSSAFVDTTLSVSLGIGTWLIQYSAHVVSAAPLVGGTRSKFRFSGTAVESSGTHQYSGSTSSVNVEAVAITLGTAARQGLALDQSSLYSNSGTSHRLSGTAILSVSAAGSLTFQVANFDGATFVYLQTPSFISATRIS